MKIFLRHPLVALAGGLMVAGMVWGQAPFDPCPGCVSDKLAHPRQPLSKPGKGEAYKDPSFGVTVRRITAANPAEGMNAIIKPAYATMSAWSATEKYLWLWHRNVGHELYDGRTYAYIRKMPLQTPTDIEHVLWDPTDDDLLYFPSNYNNLPLLKAYRISTGVTTVVHDFRSSPTNCPVSSGSHLQLGRDPQYMSHGPRKIVGLQCHPVSDGSAKAGTKFLYSIAEDAVLAVKSMGGVIAPVVAGNEQVASMDAQVFDLDLNVLRTLTAAKFSEHASVGWDTFNSAAFDDPQAWQGNLVSHNLGTGARKVIIGPATGYPYPPSATHISALARGQARDWVAVGTVGDPATGQGVLSGELVIANNLTGVVYRLAHTRTTGPSRNSVSTPYCKWGYFAEPHAVISPSGTRIAWASDWGCGDSVDTYVAELPSYTGQPLPSPTPPPDPIPTPTPVPPSPSPTPIPPSPSPVPVPSPVPSPCAVKVDIKGCVVKNLGGGKVDLLGCVIPRPCP